MFWLAVVTLATSLALAVRSAAGLRSMPRLTDIPPRSGGSAPAVSIVVPARNEALGIRDAMASLLNQRYPGGLEIIAVDDRSTDGTGEILDRLAAARAMDSTAGMSPLVPLRVLHVTELPEGWLGKNHALMRGAESAAGDLLLFTDADIVMAPDAVARAVALLERETADHVAVAPRIHTGSPWATLTVAVFLTVFLARFAPWRARDPRSRHHIGIGAFNLVRADAYHAIGGHATLSLRPDDDLRLGRALKKAGHRQLAASGSSAVRVEWYPSLGAMARGLEKNAFAVVDYRIGLIAAATALPVIFNFWPVAALLVTAGLTWWLNLAIVAVGIGSTVDTARLNGVPAWTGLAHPLGAALLLWIVWRAALRARLTGAVEWRGTRYSLAQLRSKD